MPQQLLQYLQLLCMHLTLGPLPPPSLNKLPTPQRQAWLDPVNLPTQQQLTCGVTGQVMKFLLQVYCPVDSNPVDAFHRAMFVFVSPKVSHNLYHLSMQCNPQCTPAECEKPHVDRHPCSLHSPATP